MMVQIRRLCVLQSQLFFIIIIIDVDIIVITLCPCALTNEKDLKSMIVFASLKSQSVSQSISLLVSRSVSQRMHLLS